MSKFLYPIYKLKTKSYIKWWLYHKKAGESGVLSEILEGFSFNLENTLNRKFKLFEIEGNSVQDGSPSPDNEVPILSSGDNGSINEKIINKNFLPIDENLIFTRSKTINLDTPIHAGTYVLSLEKWSTTGTGASSLINFIGTSNHSFNINNTTYKSRSITLDEEISQIILYSWYDYGSSGGITATIKGLMLSKNGGTYQPHEEQDYSIFVQQPMRSIGDVRDCFVKKDGTWYEKHNIGQVVLNGSESGWSYDSDNFYFRTSNYTFEHVPKANTNDTVQLSNYFKHTPGWGTFRNSHTTNLFYSVQNLGYKICFRNVDITTVSDWTNWLQNHNVEVIYPTEEPYYLECTEEQIEQLENKPSTYKDFTIIQSEDETPAHLKIQYYKEG